MGNVVSVELAIPRKFYWKYAVFVVVTFDTGEKGALAYRAVSEEIRDHAARAPIAGEIDARD